MPCRSHKSKEWKAVDVDEDRLASYPLARLDWCGFCGCARGSTRYLYLGTDLNLILLAAEENVNPPRFPQLSQFNQHIPSGVPFVLVSMD